MSFSVHRPRPVLREMERTMKLLDALRNDIEIIKQEIQQNSPANRRKTTKRRGIGNDDDDAGLTGGCA